MTILKTMYQDEVLCMNALLSQKNTILNIKYKLLNDHNVKNIFNLIPKYILENENLTWNEKYHFEKEIMELSIILNKFLHVLLNFKLIENIKSENLIEPCEYFPDSGGRNLMYILSHIPLIDLIVRDLNYNKTIKQNSDTFVDSMTKHQNEILFGNKRFFRREKFPPEQRFISYALQKKHAEIIQAEYESGIKDDIKNSLIILAKQFNLSKNLFETKVELGCLFWDSKIKEKETNDQKIRDGFLAIVKAFEKK